MPIGGVEFGGKGCRPSIDEVEVDGTGRFPSIDGDEIGGRRRFPSIDSEEIGGRRRCPSIDGEEVDGRVSLLAAENVGEPFAPSLCWFSFVALAIFELLAPIRCACENVPELALLPRSSGAVPSAPWCSDFIDFMLDT